ncbi:Hypothetical protein NTJ_08117 [Nesidiocoris tenuis]|uniref:Uncharacterized protein n=1 Tax=Nesidiocoris tenuis TaxID=355587 RepID=A0ABN7ASX5_9HEMI|nr:Hypothetical protein NTJ_08117 [Nesidiocoris tenuis]
MSVVCSRIGHSIRVANALACSIAGMALDANSRTSEKRILSFKFQAQVKFKFQSFSSGEAKPKSGLQLMNNSHRRSHMNFTGYWTTIPPITMVMVKERGAIGSIRNSHLRWS